jgi:ABC-2 type transport system permease protein
VSELRQALIVARREFLERVRTKWFLIVTILGPIGMVTAIVLPAYLGVKSAKEGLRVELLDRSGRDIGKQINVDAESNGVSLSIKSVTASEVCPAGECVEGEPIAALEKRIRDEKIDGYLVLPSDVLEGGTAIYYGDNASSPLISHGLREVVHFAVFRTRGGDLGLDDLSITSLFGKVNFETQQTTGQGKATSGRASFYVGYAVMFVLYISILLYAVAVLRSVIQEKSNRVVEIVVSSIKPLPLMLGKVVGVGSVGLLQLTAWGIMATLLVIFREEVLGLFGVSGAGAFEVPSLGVNDLLVILVYFLFGFFFYAAMYAAIGAMVNSEQEAQQAQTPVMLLLIVPVLCVQIVAGDPRGSVAEVLTQIPFASPILMPMRYLLDAVELPEMLLSLTILLLSLIGAVFVAAKVYRVGILSYGKKPSMKELWRWIRS